MKMGDKIKYVRELRNLTLALLSEKCGLSSPYLSDIENGKKNPSTKSLEKIAKALEADTWFFMDDNAVTFEEIANVSKFNLPDELMTFIADQKQLPYIVMAKKMSDEGLPPESMEIMFNNIMQLMKSMKVKTE